MRTISGRWALISGLSSDSPDFPLYGYRGSVRFRRGGCERGRKMAFEVLRLTSVLLVLLPLSFYLLRSARQDRYLDYALLFLAVGFVGGLFLSDFLFWILYF